MSKILVTGATGKLGNATLEHLLRYRSANDLVGLARDPGMASDLVARGVDVRKGDYSDYASLLQAFQGVEKVLLISTHAFTDRETQHANVIRAAQEAGARHVLYNPVIQKAGSTFDLMRVTQPDRFTVDLLKKSGLAYTLLSQPPFIESFDFILGDASSGVRVPAGNGGAAAASRDELAEAQAAVLSSSGHENKTYNVTGSPAVSFDDLARILSDVHGKSIPYVPLSETEYLNEKIASGLPQVVAEFALAWARGVNSGEWDVETGDLEKLIGRKPMSTAEFFAQSAK